MLSAKEMHGIEDILSPEFSKSQPGNMSDPNYHVWAEEPGQPEGEGVREEGVEGGIGRATGRCPGPIHHGLRTTDPQPVLLMVGGSSSVIQSSHICRRDVGEERRVLGERRLMK